MFWLILKEDGKIEEIVINNSLFENIKSIDENGNEYWCARELMIALEYKKWDKFCNVINDAIKACENSENIIDNHFLQVGKMINLARGAKREIKDYKLSRYACYLITQNGDSRKKAIALAQTYFVIQTRKMELTETEYEKLDEDEKRLYRRMQTKDGNRLLYKIARKKWVKNFDKFTNAGYRGLYGGEDANDIAKRKGLRYREEILDNMGSTELGANIFRITQTESLLESQKKISEDEASSTHYKVGNAIRKTIKELGGTMPEELTTPNKSLKELEKENKLIKNN